MHSHIPKQSEVDTFLKNLWAKVLHTMWLPVQVAQLVSEYSNSPHFKLLYQYIKTGYVKGPQHIRKKLNVESQDYVIINDILCQIQNQENSNKALQLTLLIVIPEKYQLMIFHQYHNNILSSHQGAWKTYLTMKKTFYFLGMLNKLKQYIMVCDICQWTSTKQNNNVPLHARIPESYYPMSRLSADVKYMPEGIDGFKYLLVVTCEYTNFVVAIPLKDIQAKTIAEALIHRVITIFGIPDMLIVDKDRALTGQVINLLLNALQCTQKIISPYNHGSSKTERQIKTISSLINKQLTDKGQRWPIFASTAAYAMNTVCFRCS